MSDIEGDGFSAVVTEPKPRVITRADNQPPGLLPAELILDDINTRFTKVLTRAQELIDSEARAPKDAAGNIVCPDAEWDKKLTDLVRSIQKTHAELEANRVNELRPYNEAVSTIHGRFRELMDKLVDPKPRGINAYKHRIEKALTDYKAKVEADQRKAREEEARKAREIEGAKRFILALEVWSAALAAAEAQRLADELAAKAKGPKTSARAAAAQEAASAAQARVERSRTESEEAISGAASTRAQAEKLASAPAADLTRSRSTAGVSSLKETVDHRDVDRAALGTELVALLKKAKVSVAPTILAILPHIPSDALEQAFRAYGRANSDAIKEDLKNGRQPLAGVTFFIAKSTRVSG